MNGQMKFSAKKAELNKVKSIENLGPLKINVIKLWSWIIIIFLQRSNPILLFEPFPNRINL